MDDYLATLNSVSVNLFGENLVEAQGTACRALLLHPPSVSQQSDLGMSASSTENSGAAETPQTQRRRKVAAKRSKQTNFSIHEDNVLCKFWLEISCDPITNTGQRKESFWLRVVNRYNSQIKNFPERSQKSIMSRWDFIKAEMSRYVGYMAFQIRSNRSGMSDSDKAVAAAADFAATEKRNFCLMHCWNILKDEPKWMELKRRMDGKPETSSTGDTTTHDSNSSTIGLDPDVSSPGSSTRKHPMGRDTAKAERKKAATTSQEYVAKMHDLSLQKISLFKESEADWKVRLDEMVNLEKVKVEEAREHRKTMVQLEREWLELDKKRLQIEAEEKEKEEDERILAINLDQCQPYQRIYYQTWQEEIMKKLNDRHCGRS